MNAYSPAATRIGISVRRDQMATTTNGTKAIRKPRWSLERQIRLVAGSIVLMAIIISVWWAPARYLAGAIGLGLTVAAITDTCLMGRLLMKLPYNRIKLG
jgi:hypothetical protein